MKWRLKWRNFELGNGEKCWSVALGIKYVAVRSGCPSTPVRTRMYWFPDDEKALAWLEKQIAIKIKAGYAELRGDRMRAPSARGDKETPRAGRQGCTNASSSQETADRPTRTKDGVTAAWRKIEQWFSLHTPDNSVPLPPSASSSEIEATEATFELKLPMEVRHSWAVHNGSGGMAFSFGRLLSLSEMANMWNGFNNSLEHGYYAGRANTPRGPIKRVWYIPQWIPVATNDEGEFVLLDLNPAPKGKKGQLIYFSRQDGATHVLAKSFRLFLERLAKDLNNGEYEFDKKHWAIKTRPG